MTSLDEEARARAEREVVEAALASGGSGHNNRLQEAVTKLKALRSPLPSPEALAVSHSLLVSDTDNHAARIAEGHWAQCLTWLVELVGHHEDPTFCTGEPPWKDGCFYCRVKEFADELEARK